MNLTFNAFLKSIKTFIPQLGIWNMIKTRLVTEVIVGPGFDWAVIDAPNDTQTVLTHLQAISGYQTAPVVRPLSSEPVTTKRFLDIGAGLLARSLNTIRSDIKMG